MCPRAAAPRALGCEQSRALSNREPLLRPRPVGVRGEIHERIRLHLSNAKPAKTDVVKLLAHQLVHTAWAVGDACTLAHWLLPTEEGLDWRNVDDQEAADALVRFVESGDLHATKFVYAFALMLGEDPIDQEVRTATYQGVELGEFAGNPVLARHYDLLRDIGWVPLDAEREVLDPPAAGKHRFLDGPGALCTVDGCGLSALAVEHFHDEDRTQPVLHGLGCRPDCTSSYPEGAAARSSKDLTFTHVDGCPNGTTFTGSADNDVIDPSACDVDLEEILDAFAGNAVAFYAAEDLDEQRWVEAAEAAAIAGQGLSGRLYTIDVTDCDEDGVPTNARLRPWGEDATEGAGVDGPDRDGDVSLTTGGRTPDTDADDGADSHDVGPAGPEPTPATEGEPAAADVVPTADAAAGDPPDWMTCEECYTFGAVDVRDKQGAIEAWERCPTGHEPRRRHDRDACEPGQAGFGTGYWYDDDPDNPGRLIAHVAPFIPSSVCIVPDCVDKRSCTRGLCSAHAADLEYVAERWDALAHAIGQPEKLVAPLANYHDADVLEAAAARAADLGYDVPLEATS